MSVGMQEKFVRTRVIVKKGTEYFSQKAEELALFYSDKGIVYTYNRDGSKFIVDDRMTSLTDELDNRIFFRANRQVIININFVKSFKSIDRVRLMVAMKIPCDFSLLISQVTAPMFRRWIYKL
jgi:DNA-binding LytR/AlgR family response regulator